MPSWKKQRPKVRGKKEVIDEWETMDVDRDEQERGLKRRARRWRDIEKAQAEARKVEREALKTADKIRKDIRRPRNVIEEAWLKYDYVLANIMERRAHEFLDKIRVGDVELYNKILNIFISPYTKEHVDIMVQYFANGLSVAKKIALVDIVKEYRKLKGIRTKITVKHKGEDGYDL